MARFRVALSIVLTLAAVAGTARAQQCNLQLTLTCGTFVQDAPTPCTQTTLNAGTNACAGQFFTGFLSEAPPALVSIGEPSSPFGDGGDCFSSGQFGSQFASSFAYCFGDSSLAPGASLTSTVHVIPHAGAPTIVPLTAFTEAVSFSGDILGLAFAVNGQALPTCTPTASVAALTQSGAGYDLTWTAVAQQQAQYIIEESTSPDFTANLVTRNEFNVTKETFQHTVTGATRYYYRVRAASCSGGPGPFSATVNTLVQGPPATTTGRSADAVVPFGSNTPVSFSVFVPAPAGKTGSLDTGFSAATDKPYLTVTPSSGTIPPGGTTVIVTANPSALPPGANTGTLTVSSGGAKLSSTSVSVSLVTPVGPAGKTKPPSNSLIIPIVTHVSGASATFQSDVRLTNASSGNVTYQVALTPTRTDATQSTKSTMVTVPAGQTIALNDIVKDFFGIGATSDPNDVGAGSLEIRPSSSTNLTYASSRTYATTLLGTLGQYIAAVPFTKFATNVVNGGVPIPGTPPVVGNPVLSLQQIAQSTRFRTNLGIVEGSGAAASGKIRIIDDLGAVLKEVPFSLLPGEHQQLNSFLSSNGVPTLEDGRIEIVITSATGAVSAYASVLDNTTTDPLAVMPVEAKSVSANRYVLPGMADLIGATNFHSDVRIYNAGSSAATITPLFYPSGQSAAPLSAATITIPPGQVKAVDEVLPTLFGEPARGKGGSIVLTTPTNTSLVATGRTYTVASGGGTFGQFIPGVSPAEGIGVGDKPLQILQLEQSANFRTNIGLAELSGNPVSVRLTLILPDANGKTAPVFTTNLAPFEFQQFSGIIGSTLNPGQSTYNARVVVEVLSGTGRVTACGSVIDNATQDPTYVPAQ